MGANRACSPLPYDGHTHTTFSDGRNSLAENVRAAEALGLRCLAITDHYYGEGEELYEWVRQIARYDAASEVTVVPGIEVTILDPDGEVSCGEDERRLVRWVLADIGWRTRGIGRLAPTSKKRVIDNAVAAMVNAAANPNVDAIAHPFNLGRFDVRVYPTDFALADLERIAEAMADNGCAFELMNQIYWWYPELSIREFEEQYVPILRVFAEAGVVFCVGSDAHSCGAVGNLGYCKRLMELAGITMDQVLDLAALNAARLEGSSGER